MKIIPLKVAAMAALMLAGSAPAMAAPTSLTFNTVGNTAINGTYGNAISFNTTTASTLKMSVTAWDSNLFTNTITSAYLGAYGGGLGVTGRDDFGGASNLHQIDNVGSYTDFVMLEFNRPVTLTSIVTNSYGIGGLFGNKAVWYDASQVVTPAWNSTVGFATNYATLPAAWSAVASGASGATRAISATTASDKWLVGAAFGPLFDRDDGFKIYSINVFDPAAAVPEPATWGMIILGVGLMGAAMRRERRRRAAIALA